LKFAHEQENDQLKSIGLDDKKLQNWPTSASTYNKKNIGEEEDSKPSSDIEDIVQIEDVSKDDELNKNLENTRGQTGSSQSEQEPITPAVLTRQVRPVCSTGQTGTKQIRPVAQTGQTGSDQGRPKILKSERPKINGGEDRNKHKNRKPKLSFDELLAKYLKENEAKRANQSDDVKSSRVPPKHNFGSWNWQRKIFYPAALYSPLGPSMPIPYAPHPTSLHPYSSSGWDNSWAHTPSYLRPYHVEYLAPSNSDFGKQPYNKDRFIPKNRSGAQNKNKVVKQVYVVKKDNRKGKGSDLNSYVAKPNKVLDTSASSAKTVEKSASNIVGTKSEPRNFNVPNVDKDVLLSKTKSQPRSSLGLSNWHKKKLEKLSACELKKRNMTWVPKGSSQAQSKDGARAKSEMDASKKKAAKISTEMFAPNHQSYWSSHHPYFSVVPHIGMSCQGMFSYPSWHYFNPYMSSCYGGMQPNYYAYG